MTGYESISRTFTKSPNVSCDLLAETEVQKTLKEYFKTDNWLDVMDKLGSDKRSVVPRYIGPELKMFSDGSFECMHSGGPREKKIETPSGLISSFVFHPWSDIESIEQLEGRYGWNGRLEWWDFKNIARQIDILEERGDYWIATFGDPSGLQHLTMWVGDEAFLCILAADEELAVAMIEKHNEDRLRYALNCLEAGGGRINELDGGGDYGTQRGLLIRPEMFRRYFKPLYAKFYKEIKSNYDVKIQFHSCGSIVDIIPDLIEVGVDILDPIQTSAAGMDPANLKANFGESLVFHGGIDIQNLLPNGTPDEVRRGIREMHNILGNDGGYIIAPSHNIQVDTPVENILAMYDEISKLKNEIKE
jgi:uroporphyrinogen decarboxylase